MSALPDDTLRLSGLLEAIPLTWPSGARVGVVLGSVAFTVLFHLSYVSFVSPLFAYVGAIYDPPGGAVRAIPWILALVPALWVPVRVARPSEFFLWVLYATVYVPSMFAPFYARTATDQDTLRFMLTLAAAFAMLSLVLAFPALRLPRLRIPKLVFWLLLGTIGTMLNLYLLVYFHSHLRLVGLMEVNAQRLAAREVAQGTAVSYAGAMLANAINPFLMAFGVERRRAFPFLAGAFGQVFLYAAAANKLHLLSIPIILAVRWLLRRDGRQFGVLMTLGIAGSLAVAWLIQGSSPVAGVLTGILTMRTITLPGLLSGQYLAFFATHPHTHLSHVHGFSSLIRYPYELSIPHEIGEYFYRDPNVNANAHFWVFDGVAAFGLPGVLLITPLVMLTFWLLDSVTRPRDARLTILMCVLQAAVLANGSIFSTLLGGALWGTWLLAYLMPDASRRSSPAPDTASVGAGGGALISGP